MRAVRLRYTSLNGAVEIAPSISAGHIAIVEYVYVQYTSIGPPTGGRQIRIYAITQNGDPLCASAGDFVQPNNTTYSYCAFPGAQAHRLLPGLGGDIQWCPWPTGLWLQTGEKLSAKCTNLVVPNDEITLVAQLSVGPAPDSHPDAIIMNI